MSASAVAAREEPAARSEGRHERRPPPSVGALALTGLVGGAGAIHLALIPEHFGEGAAFGVFFVAASAFQLWLAAALLLRPGPRIHRAGLWGTAALVATWMVTRLIPPPAAAEPEPVELWGVLATALEVAAIVALAASLPAVGPALGPVRRRLLAAGAATGFVLLVILASGIVTVIPEGRWSGPEFLLRPWSVGSWRLDGLWLVVAGRWSALIPWLVVAFAIPAALLVAWTVSLALRFSPSGRRSARRRGVLASVPAYATVPVCCGAPLAAFAAGTAVGTLFRFTPWLMAVSLALLAWNVLVLRRSLGEGRRGADGP
ncbi:MAG: hypothetical protein ACRDIZ_02160 [Actinomycetota bacterium]